MSGHTAWFGRNSPARALERLIYVDADGRHLSLLDIGNGVGAAANYSHVANHAAPVANVWHLPPARPAHVLHFPGNRRRGHLTFVSDRNSNLTLNPNCHLTRITATLTATRFVITQPQLRTVTIPLHPNPNQEAEVCDGDIQGRGRCAGGGKSPVWTGGVKWRAQQPVSTGCRFDWPTNRAIKRS